MRRTKRTLQAFIVVLIGLWALSATEAQASARRDYCDEYYCLPNETCSEQQIFLWCNNACPGWIWGECGIIPGWCDGNDSYYLCSTTPE